MRRCGTEGSGYKILLRRKDLRLAAKLEAGDDEPDGMREHNNGHAMDIEAEMSDRDETDEGGGDDAAEDGKAAG